MKRTTLCAIAILCACRGTESGAPTPAPTGTPSPPAPSNAPAAAASTTSEAAATAAPSASSTATATAKDANEAKTWSFDADKADAPPAGFFFGRTGNGKDGRWVVQAAADAPSKGNVLAQLDADATDFRFPVAVVDGSSYKDVKLAVSCKPVSGKVDQACGLVWRFKDANNYYLTRANALEDNVRIYHVKDGNRIQFASWNGKVASKVWHRLQVEARGDHFVVSFDDQKVLDAKDSTFADGGKVGLWTKADSVTQFDDLSATPL